MPLRLRPTGFSLSSQELAGFTAPIAVAVGGLFLAWLADALVSDVKVAAALYLATMVGVHAVALLLAPRSPLGVAAAMALMDLYWYGMMYLGFWAGDSLNFLNLVGVLVIFVMEEVLGSLLHRLPDWASLLLAVAASFTAWYLIGVGLRRLLRLARRRA